MSKAADTGAKSMRYGDSTAAITRTWLVIDKYRDAKAQLAITSAARPVAVWGSLLIFDNFVVGLLVEDMASVLPHISGDACKR